MPSHVDTAMRFPIKMWLGDIQIEQQAMEQLWNVAQLPFIYKWIAVMPDVHAGMGATIGSVIPTRGAVIPAAVGVDIGCGMQAVQTNLVAEDINKPLADIRAAIERAVPHGRTANGGKEDRGAWGNPPDRVKEIWEYSLEKEYKEIIAHHHRLRKANSINHLGTLGTGNHFIEVCLDEEDKVWLMLHSGSRGIGNSIGSYFIRLAKEECKKWFVNLPDSNLAYLPQGTELFKDYLKAVKWAQQFAFLNRHIMMERTLESLSGILEREIEAQPFIDCHHNFVQWENHYGENILVTRKGATSAKNDQLGIIPGSMGAKSFIVRGLGNPESFNSCSHGAGRMMSRTEARRRFTVEDHQAATEGIECRKDSSVLDETPASYKPIESVMAAQSDLVKPVHTLRQIICIKG